MKPLSQEDIAATKPKVEDALYSTPFLPLNGEAFRRIGSREKSLRKYLLVDFEDLQNDEENRYKHASGHESPKWVRKTLVLESISHED